MKYTIALFSSVTASVIAGGSYVSPVVPSNQTHATTYTEVLSSYTTFCPSATEIVHNSNTYTVTTATTLTITDCPCTITYSS